MNAVLKQSLVRGDLAFADADVRRHIPYAAHVNDTVIRTESGDLVAVLRLDGVSIETLARDEIDSFKDRRNESLKALANPALSLWTHLVRRKETRYPGGDFPPGYARDLDARWKARYETRQFYRNELYISLVVRGPGKKMFGGSLFKRKSPREMERALRAYEARALATLTEAMEKLRANYVNYGAHVLSLYEDAGVLYSEQLAFFNGLVRNQWQRVAAPRMHARDLLAPGYIAFGLNRENLDVIEFKDVSGATRYGGMLGIKEYPPGTASTMMDAFLTAPCELVVAQSFEYQQKARTLEAMRRQKNRYSSSEDAAADMAQDLHQARNDLAASVFAWGDHQLSVLVLGDSQRELKDGISHIDSELSDCGLLTVRETKNLELAYWAQLPANGAYRTRHVGISTFNLACFYSGHAFAQGKPNGNHWGPAVSAMETRSGTPYYFSYHLGTLGHTTWFGPSDSGKTTGALFCLMQAQRFRPRTIVFDKDRGAEIAIRAMGGHYNVLRACEPTGWNPFGLDGTPQHKMFLRAFLAQLVTRPGEQLNTEDREAIAKAVDRIYDLDPCDRRMQRLQSLIPRRSGGDGIDRRFAAWYGAGEWAWLFDNDTDHLSLAADTHGFDLTSILKDPNASGGALAWLFYRVERQRDGRRTIILVEEGWYAVTMAAFENSLRDLLKTGRKDDILVNFSTQEVGDAIKSDIGQTIIQQSATLIFFPNAKASREEYVDGCKLTEREYELIQKILPGTRCFLIKQGSRSAVVRLDLTGMEGDIAVLSGRRKNVEWLDALRDKVGDKPEAWLPLYWEHITGEKPQ